jgi:hypothetical protein
MTVPRRCAVALVLALLPALARAEPCAPPPPDPPAVARVADALSRALPPSPARVLVVAAPLTSDAAAPRGAELAALVAAQIAGRRGEGARAHAAALPLAAAREAALGEAALLHVVPTIAAGKLRVAIDLYPVPSTLWARLRDPAPGPAAHAFAEAPVDAEVRSYLAPVPLGAASIERARSFEGDVVALACGDLDGDGALEIASVSRRRVTTLRLRGAKVAPLRSRPWGELAPVSPAPLREPIAFATIGDRGALATLDVGLTDRARSLRLDASLEITAAFPGLALPDPGGTACAAVAGAAIAGPLAPCVAGDRAPLAPAPLAPADAYAAASLVGPRGERRGVSASREGAKVELRDESGRRQAIDGAGAQLALGDLDQDGMVEIIHSLDTLSPLSDAVVVRSWLAPEGRVVERYRLPAPAGVRALAVCPPDGPGAAPFVVATSDEVWIVR